MINELRRHEVARQMVSDLCNGKRKWIMSIPARLDCDPDLIIAASLADVPKLCAQIVALEDKILDIISEFGDDPVQCLQIICEDIQLRQHYRAYPNAPRVEEPT